MYLPTYQLDPACFLAAPGLALQAALKRKKIKLELLTNIDILLSVEKGIKCGKCHAIFQYVKSTNKYISNYEKNIE